MTEIDSPPIALVRELIPEVVERVQAVVAAVEAARTARGRWLDVQEPFPASAGGGATRRALAEDVDAVRAGRQPTAYAALVAARPQLDGERRACEAYAEELVVEFNLHAHESVKQATRKRLGELRDAAAAACVAAAEKALAAADGAGVDDGQRLRAAMGDLADLDRAATRWRDLEALLGWCLWDRPIRSGAAWDPLTPAAYPNPREGAEVLNDPIVHALSLADDNMRRQIRGALERRPNLAGAR